MSVIMRCPYQAGVRKLGFDCTCLIENCLKLIINDLFVSQALK